MKKWILLTLTLAFAAPLHAQTAAPAAAESRVMSDGVVRKIDAANGKITLKHGPLDNLDMPPMTMVFRVKPPELMNGLKAGDAVRFHAESIDGSLTVTTIRVAP